MKPQAMLASVVLLAACLAQSVGGEELDAGGALTPDEEQLIAIIDQLGQRQQLFYTQAGEIEDLSERLTFRRKQDPIIEYIPLLLAFEQQHRGTRAGLMALRHILRYPPQDGVADDPRALGCREALRRLPFYSDRSELPVVLGQLTWGQFESLTEPYLRGLAEDERAPARNRWFARFTLAKWMLEYRDGRENLQRYLVEAEASADPIRLILAERYSALLALLPDQEQLAEWEKEAVAILRELADPSDPRRRGTVIGIDPHWYIVRVEVTDTDTMPTLVETATGILFKELHLRPDRPAPELELTLLNGEKWSMTAQRGKIVVIQFSFKGCGPCEQMYPDLRELQQEYGDDLSLLSIMTDERKSDTEEAVASGTLTWDVYWDGDNGPIMTQWGVTGFPTVYVIDRTAHVAAVNIDGDALKNKVGELIGR